MLAGLTVCCLAVNGSWAQPRQVPDRFTATTANMTPADTQITIDLLEWSDAAARAAVLAALSAETDPRAALIELPTLGYVWIEGSSVGYSIKYAHRTTGPGGDERATFVTDRPLGSYSFSAWQIGDPGAAGEAAYSVIEFDLSQGTGLLSPAAEVIVDEGNAIVSFKRDAAIEPVLVEARMEPKPYWAQDG
jgi:hypothetical protein